jgi:hypothetical protein
MRIRNGRLCFQATRSIGRTETVEDDYDAGATDVPNRRLLSGAGRDRLSATGLVRHLRGRSAEHDLRLPLSPAPPRFFAVSWFLLTRI